MNDLIYSAHVLPCGIRVEEISGGEELSGKVSLLLARQIYCEKGRNGYRTISHFESGAPYADDYEGRISVTHTPGLFAVASLPRTPEADLSQFSLRTAMGVDAERADRSQAVRVRERFLSDEELSLVEADSVEKNVIAWTAKEAMLKAGMNPSLDIRQDIRILSMPSPGEASGKGTIRLDGKEVEVELYSVRTGGFILTLAFSPKCATFKKIG